MELNDEEIKKALECCASEIGCMCSQCPLNRDEDCLNDLPKYTFALINRQQAEIERLEFLLNQLFKDVDYKLQYIYELEKKLESDQSEAIKEFAERLRLRAIKTRFDAMYGAVIEISNDTITELVKEVVGGENA